MKQGKLTAHGVRLEPHELETVVFFLNLGKDIELIKPSNTPNVKNADYFMDGLIWEAKSPRGASKYLVRDTLLRALKQSEHIIVDLRRTKQHPTRCLRELEKYFQVYQRVKNLKVITRDGRLIEYVRKI